jgi:hypothetical protein
MQAALIERCRQIRPRSSFKDQLGRYKEGNLERFAESHRESALPVYMARLQSILIHHVTGQHTITPTFCVVRLQPQAPGHINSAASAAPACTCRVCCHYKYKVLLSDVLAVEFCFKIAECLSCLFLSFPLRHLH